MKIDATIFRGYDIRGYTHDVPEKDIKKNLTEDVALNIGMALGSRLEEGSTVVISGDHRIMTTKLRQALVDGYTAVGINVKVDEGQVPSGANNWYLIRHGLDGAVQVTGSHNPWYFDGMKISEGMEALYGEQLKELIPKIEEGKYRLSKKKGNIEKINIVDSYIQMLNKAFPEPFKCKHRIIFDAGNGLGGLLVPLLQERGADVIALLTKPDGSFPYHDADPSDKEAAELVSEALEATNRGINSPEDKWYGLLTDGDADRSGFVAENAEVVWPEKMAAIFYKEYLLNSKNDEEVMALDVRASNAAMKIVSENGGRGFFIPAGYPSHRLFARLIIPEIGKTKPTHTTAEASGHFFYPTASMGENSNFVPHAADILIDDGLYSALKFIYILDEFKTDDSCAGVTLQELMDTIPSNPTGPEIRVSCDDKEKFQIVDKIKAQISKDYKDDLKALCDPLEVGDGKSKIKIQKPDCGLIEVDGVRAQFKDHSWFLIRASNTVPKLTLKFEAPSYELLYQRMQEVNNIFKEYSTVEPEPLEKAIESFWEEIKKEN
ncbi:hypothetical protein GF312_21485 [Candidatus Poribacteria bacterium]|nr:hypothetical protein [Candidatus Poribacteria bacterium]